MKKQIYFNLFVVPLFAAALVASTAQAQRFLQESSDGVGCYANTAKDGSGTYYLPLIDSDGHFQVDVLSGGGGGVQYTEADTDTTVTGTAFLCEGPSNTLEVLQCDASKHLQVDIAADSVGIGGGTQWDDGDGIDTDSQGQLIVGTTDVTGTARAVITDNDGHLQIDVLSSALPTGASTSANQSTIIGHVDGVETLLGTIDADTSAMNTNLATLAGAVDGTEIQVDIVSGSSAGTEYTEGDTDATFSGPVVQAEGPLNTATPLQVDASKHLQIDIAADSAGLATAANQSTIAGHVDGIEALLGTIDTDTGNIATSVAAIEAAQLADGHNVTVDNAAGASAVNIQDGGNSITVDGTVTANLSGTDNTVLDNIDADATTIIGHVDGVETLLGTIDADTSAMNTNLATLAGAVDGTEIQVDIVSGSSAGTEYTEGDVDTTFTGPLVQAEGPSDTATPLQVDASKNLQIDIAADSAGLATAANQSTIIGHVDGVEGLLTTIDADTGAILADTANMDTNLGTIAGAVSGTEMQCDVLTLPASTNTIEVVGDVADDVAASGNPVQIAGFAIETDGTDPGAVNAEADAARLRTDLNRRLLVNTTHPNWFRASENYATAQTDNELVADPGDGFQICVTDVIFSNGATAGSLKLVETTSGSADVLELIYAPINGGAVINLSTPLCITASENLGFTSATVTTHSITVLGFRQAT